MLRRRGLPLPTLVLALATLWGCATVPVTGRTQLDLVPSEQLTALAGDSYEAIVAEAELSSDPHWTALVRDVGKRVAGAAEEFLREHDLDDELRHYDWEFALLADADQANAFCMPGGKIGVYTGILPLVRDENGLAVVVGHEVAHAIANHGGERMSQLLVAELGGMALAAAVEEKPQRTRELAMLAYGIGAQVGVLLPYSRTHESEADRIGLILTARAGYDPREAVSFWQRMAQAKGPEPPEFLSTHPSSDRRLQEIREYLPEALEHYGSAGGR